MMNALKRIGGCISAFLPHLILCYALMLLTFFVINLLNPSMQFLDSRLSQRFALLFVILTVTAAVIAIVRKRVPIPAVLVIIACAAYIVPDLRALAADDAQFVATQYYSIMTLITALCALVFAVADIVKMRKAAQAD